MKIKKRSMVIAIVITVVISTMTVILVWQHNKSLKNPTLKIMSDNVDLQVKNVNYTDVGDSGLKWEIKADSAKYFKSEKLALFDKVRVKLVMKDGRTLLMTGDKGKLNTESRDMEVSGNVEIISDKGDHLTTDILKYSGSEQRIHTSAAVKMENDRMDVKGIGLSFSVEDKDVALLSKVKANIK